MTFSQKHHWVTVRSGSMDVISNDVEQTDISYLGPLCHLPLRTTGRALTGPPLHGSLQVGHGAEVTVDGAVQARGEHLPTANLAELETLPAGPWTLTPAAGLPSERQAITPCPVLHFKYFWYHGCPVECTWADIPSQCRSRGLVPVGSARHSTYRAPQCRHSEYMWRRTLTLLDSEDQTQTTNNTQHIQDTEN